MGLQIVRETITDMSEKYIFWDLDGTLTDSSEGITKGAKYALSVFGLDKYELDELKVFIGPPLRDTFPKFGVPLDKVEEAVAAYRSVYNVTGKYQNVPYEGIEELLIKLQKAGFRHYVATSKPEELSKDILHKFGLDKYFEIICGSTEDGRIDSKESVIEYLLSQIGSVEDVVMIGDTEFDVIGAACHNIPTIGVTWGFGDHQRMLEAGAKCLVNTPLELYEALTK